VNIPPSKGFDAYTYLQIGASKVSLSSMSSQELWEKSGRLTEGSDEVGWFFDLLWTNH
jgi:prolyl-tRNA synthetase